MLPMIVAMNPAYFSAFAALAGSVIGGLTTFAAAWVTQRHQANVQWLLQEKTRRQELYQEFIEEASKLYVDALTHDQAAIPPLVGLYASVNKMRVVSRLGVAERADELVRMIVDAYFLPNKTLPELRAMIKSGALDFMRDFSQACREELKHVRDQERQGQKDSKPHRCDTECGLTSLSKSGDRIATRLTARIHQRLFLSSRSLSP